MPAKEVHHRPALKVSMYMFWAKASHWAILASGESYCVLVSGEDPEILGERLLMTAADTFLWILLRHETHN